MEFLYPQYLWWLLAIPVLTLLWSLGVWHHRGMRARFGDLTNLQEISRISRASRGWLRGALFAGSLAGMILGLSSPHVLGQRLRPVPMPTDVIFLLDISPSMFAKDMDPNRLGRAERIIEQFIVHKLPDDRYALVSFNFSSIILSYLTRDPRSILLYFDYLNQTSEPATGTNTGAALVNGLHVIEADEHVNPQNAEKRRHVLILISDGDDNVGQWAGPLADVIRRRIRLYTIGLGTATGAFVPLLLAHGGEVLKYATARTGERVTTRAQARTLRDLAERTGARFYRGEDNRQVQAAIDDVLTTGRPVGGYQADPITYDLYFYFLMAAFVSMIAGIFL